MERSVPFNVLIVRVGSSMKQKLRKVKSASDAGYVKSSSLQISLRIYINIVVKDNLGDVVVAFVNCNMEGCPVFFVVTVDISTVVSILLLVQGILHTVCITSLSCIQQVLVGLLVVNL